ncbi:unnamed protein product [Sphenostylis stenocarpa]|uniref:Uncharacterized protein n=1 Tax=Sphenostylis stenocarpa TaxID=92480 RepID=A0AA86SIR4_9FABA|nr:unnamed protein product [Sphenostylis stenocarpa]
MEESNDALFDEWDHAMLEELFVLTASAPKPTPIPNPSSSSSIPHALPCTSYHLPQPLPSAAIPFLPTASSFSPPRELSQRTTTVPVDFHPNPPSDKDLEIEHLKFQVREKEQRELEHATKQIANLGALTICYEVYELKLKVTTVGVTVGEYVPISTEFKPSAEGSRDFGTLAPNCHKISSKFHNGLSSNDPIVESTFKVKGVKTDIVSHQEALGTPSDLPAYLDLSQKFLAIWGSPTKKMGHNLISKLLVGCQRDFHILFGCMNMSLPSEITRELFSDLSSSGVALHYLKDRFHTPEAAKMSNLYLALTKIADGTDVLETLIEPLVDLCGMENVRLIEWSLAHVVIVHSSLCVLHMLLKLILELENNVGKSLFDPVSCDQLPCGWNDVPGPGLVVLLGVEGLWDNVFIEGLCIGKDLVSGVKDGNLVNEEISKKAITEERVRVEAVSIMELLFLRSNAYFEREQFSQKIVFKTISELLKKDAGLCVKKHALRLLYLVLNCWDGGPKLLAAFCCGCREGGDSNAMDENESTSDFQNFKIILQGLSDCVASHRGGLLELKVSRNVILVLAFLASSGQPGFEIFVGHRLSSRGNYLLLILQLLVSEMDFEAGSYEQQPEIFRERTFLIREILILLNRLVSSPSYSATVLRGLTTTRDMAGLTIDVASRLSRKGKKNERQDSMVKHIRETEIVDLARLFKKRVGTASEMLHSTKWTLLLF